MLFDQGYSRDDDQSEEQTAESSDSDNDTYIHQEIVQQPRKHLQGTIILKAHNLCIFWRWY